MLIDLAGHESELPVGVETTRFALSDVPTKLQMILCRTVKTTVPRSQLSQNDHIVTLMIRLYDTVSTSAVRSAHSIF